MHPTEFRRAADRGMGRAALCLIENDPAPYLPDLLETCFLGIDQNDRVEYLFALIAFARAEVWVEDRLLERLPAHEYEYQAKQVWALLNRFAMAHFRRSRAAILARALRDDDGAKLVAEWGVEGLRWLMMVRPEAFEGDGSGLGWDLAGTAANASGLDTVDGMLSEEFRSARNASYSRLCVWERPAGRLSWEEFLARIRQLDSQSDWGFVYRYAETATPEDLRQAAEWALTEEGRTRRIVISLLFRKHPWPLDPGLVFDRLDDPVEGYVWREVLAGIDDPRIRELAFERLEREEPDWSYAIAMASSVTDSDSDRLLRIAESISTPNNWEPHDFLIGLGEMAKRAKPGLLPVLAWGMENSLCAQCRKDIADGLARHGLLPEPFRAEAGYDVEYVHPYADDRRSLVLSPGRFRCAARKGQGRAVLSAIHGPSLLYAPEVRSVALFDAPSLYREMEPRAAYLLDLAERVGVQEDLLDALLHAIAVETDDEYTHDWHLALVSEYAKRGNVRAQSALPPEENSEREPKPKRTVSPTAEELAVRFDAESDLDLLRREARVFGRKASDDELRLWAERMLREEDADTLDAMGEAFVRRAWPLAPEWVIERAKESDKDDSIWPRLLPMMPNPEVRTFALARLAQKEPDPNAVGYLRSSFQSGDETAIYAVLPRFKPDDWDATTACAWELGEMARVRGPETFVPHLEWVIENSSSSRYRKVAVELLLGIGALSDYHREEVRYDAEPEIRALVESV